LLELTPEGRLGIAGTEYLAGSGVNLAQCVARAVNMGSISLAEALSLATRNPGRLLNIGGRLVIGASADLLTFRWTEQAPTLEIVNVVANGKSVQ